MSVLLGRGTYVAPHMFAPFVDYGAAPPWNGGYTSLAVGDFEGSGNLDFALVNQIALQASVFVGNGDGTFAVPSLVSGPNLGGPVATGVGDFNGDGKSDLVVANSYPSSLTVLLSSGGGTFGAYDVVNVGPNSINDLAVGNLNRDAKPDIVAVNGGTSVWVILGSGDGGLDQPVEYPIGQKAGYVGLGDFNGDGNPDIVTSNTNNSELSILLGNGDGAFGPAMDVAPGGRPFKVASGDFNGDGNEDLAVSFFGGSRIAVLEGQGDGTFGPPTSYFAGDSSSDIFVGDFNGDGRRILPS